MKLNFILLKKTFKETTREFLISIKGFIVFVFAAILSVSLLCVGLAFFVLPMLLYLFIIPDDEMMRKEIAVLTFIWGSAWGFYTYLFVKNLKKAKLVK